MGRTSAINPADICQASDVLCTFAVRAVEVEGSTTARGVWLCLCQLWCTAAGELPWGLQLLLGDGQAPELAVLVSSGPHAGGLWEILLVFFL